MDRPTLWHQINVCTGQLQNLGALLLSPVIFFTYDAKFEQILSSKSSHLPPHSPPEKAFMYRGSQFISAEGVSLWKERQILLWGWFGVLYPFQHYLTLKLPITTTVVCFVICFGFQKSFLQTVWTQIRLLL